MRDSKEIGLEEIDRLKNRIARLYGQGRLDPDTFQDLNQRLLELRQLFREGVTESDK